MDLLAVKDILERNGLNVSVEGNHLSLVMNDLKSVIHIDEKDLSLTCSVCTLGEIKEDSLPQLLFMALNSNTVINPFAFAILESENGEIEDSMLVITDKMVQDNITETALVNWTDSLRLSICQAFEILKNFK